MPLDYDLLLTAFSGLLDKFVATKVIRRGGPTSSPLLNHAQKTFGLKWSKREKERDERFFMAGDGERRI